MLRHGSIKRFNIYKQVSSKNCYRDPIIFYTARLGQQEHKCQKKNHNDQTYTNIASQKELSQTISHDPP